MSYVQAVEAAALGNVGASVMPPVTSSTPKEGERMVRGPVSHVTESFLLEESGGVTTLRYTGELGTDFWMLGERWGDVVAARWESVVAESLRSVKQEAERQAAPRDGHDIRSHG